MEIPTSILPHLFLLSRYNLPSFLASDDITQLLLEYNVRPQAEQGKSRPQNEILEATSRYFAALLQKPIPSMERNVDTKTEEGRIPEKNH